MTKFVQQLAALTKEHINSGSIEPAQEEAAFNLAYAVARQTFRHIHARAKAGDMSMAALGSEAWLKEEEYAAFGGVATVMNVVLDPGLNERLLQQSRRENVSPNHLINRLLDDGLTMTAKVDPTKTEDRDADR